VAGGWRRMYNEELRNLYASPNIISMIKSMSMRWTVARMAETINACNILVGKPEGNRHLDKPKHRWEGNIRMDLREIGCEGVDWVHLTQDRYQ
jgi:hypothetical protein